AKSVIGIAHHYTSHKFIPFWWKSFVHHIRNSDSNNNTSIVVEENIDNLFQDKIKPLSHSEEKMDIDEHAKNTNTIDASKDNSCMFPNNDNEMDIDHQKLFIGGGEKYIVMKIYTFNNMIQMKKLNIQVNIKTPMMMMMMKILCILMMIQMMRNC
ncbi:hypothetical protein BYT27DRAFT_7082085, partial [Phlegmacium glaucopus]